MSEEAGGGSGTCMQQLSIQIQCSCTGFWGRLFWGQSNDHLLIKDIQTLLQFYKVIELKYTVAKLIHNKLWLVPDHTK